jgi:hypothetical protein
LLFVALGGFVGESVKALSAVDTKAADNPGFIGRIAAFVAEASILETIPFRALCEVTEEAAEFGY